MNVHLYEKIHLRANLTKDEYTEILEDKCKTNDYCRETVLEALDYLKE